MEKVNCFIRKNTPELRKRIEEIGVKLCPCVTFHYAIWLDYSYYSGECNTVHGAPVYDEDIMERDISCFLKDAQEEGSIDCGENEEMFLALIALRDDTDKNQWFVNNRGEWYINRFNELAWWVEMNNMKWHKATVEEIVEHFKTK